MNKHPFIAGLTVGIIAFSALTAAAFLLFPELLFIIKEFEKLLTGSL